MVSSLPASRRRLWRAWLFRGLRAWTQPGRDGENIGMLVLAAVVGVLAGGAAVLFGMAIHGVQILSFRAAEPTESLLRTLPWWQILFVPAAGGLAVGLLTTYAVGEARGHGVPEVMKSLALLAGRIRGRVAAAKLVASALTIGTGGSCGREGPVIQIGAAIGSKAGQVLRLGPRQLRTLVGCGAAAGIAATFNAPIAGAVFACEVLLGGFGLTLFGPIVISSVVATMTMRFFNGPAPVFRPPPCGVVSPEELAAYVLLGLAAGLVSWAYIRLNALVQELLAEDLTPGAYVVIGADTMVVKGERIFGKPTSATHATQMLLALSGCTHQVMTGVSVWMVLVPEPGQVSVGFRSFTDESQVTFRTLSEEEIVAYLRTGESFDKAGAYAIQGEGRRFVCSVQGAIDTVIGLPVQRLLREFPELC